MASCRQVEPMLEAWVDNELGHADRVIVDQHLAECRSCASLMRAQQRTAALLFETFNDHRLRHNLRPRVLEHLPEMDSALVRIRQRRNQMRTLMGGRGLARYVPAVVMLFLGVFAVLLYMEWPPLNNGEDAIGMVTQVQGTVRYEEPGVTGGSRPATLKDIVTPGEAFATGAGSKLMVALGGPSQIKLNANTWVRIVNERELVVEQGQVWLDIAKADRYFKVTTPTGDITVFGTVFDVKVATDSTVVTVQNGRVQVENAIAAGEVRPGEQVEVVADRAIAKPQKVDVVEAMNWSRGIEADHEAYALFTENVQHRFQGQLSAEQVFVIINGNARSINSFQLSWLPSSVDGEHCGYDLYVYNEHMVELFREHIDASVFADAEQRTYEVKVPGKPLTALKVIHIKIAPDLSAGNVKTSFTKISALGS